MQSQWWRNGHGSKVASLQKLKTKKTPETDVCNQQIWRIEWDTAIPYGIMPYLRTLMNIDKLISIGLKICL